MEPTDLTVQVLREIRDELRSGHEKQDTERERYDVLRVELHDLRRETGPRIEALDANVRDLSHQLILLRRGIKVSIESRETFVARLNDHERRLAALESQRSA